MNVLDLPQSIMSREEVRLVNALIADSRQPPMHANCQPQGDQHSPQFNVGAPIEEDPLDLPVMNWESEQPSGNAVMANTGADDEGLPLPVMNWDKSDVEQPSGNTVTANYEEEGLGLPNMDSLGW